MKQLIGLIFAYIGLIIFFILLSLSFFFSRTRNNVGKSRVSGSKEFDSRVNKTLYFFRFMGVDLSVPFCEEYFVCICKCQTSVNTRHFITFSLLKVKGISAF